MKPNRMKEKLRAGEPVFGVSVMIPSPQIVEMIGAAGFDWVLLDCEHGTLTLESVELMAMAAPAYASAAEVVRCGRRTSTLRVQRNCAASSQHTLCTRAL